MCFRVEAQKFEFFPFFRPNFETLFFLGLLVEMWRRFKAIDHPKWVIGHLGRWSREGHPEIRRTHTVKPAPHHVPLVVAWSSCSVRSRNEKET